MRRLSQRSLTSHMRTGILRLCETCVSEIAPAGWGITRRIAGSFRMTPKSSNGLPTFAIAQKNRRGDEEDYRSLDFVWGTCLDARGCTRAASSAAKDESSTGKDRKAAAKERRGKERGGKRGGKE